MLQSVVRISPVPPIHAIAAHAWNDHEPGRITPEQAAAEANFAKPLGAAQATMAKINALAARAEAQQVQTEQPPQHQALTQPEEKPRDEAQTQAVAQVALASAPGPSPAPRGKRLDLRA